MIRLTARGTGPLALLLVCCAAHAAGTCADFLNALAQRESSGNAQAVNRYGYAGLWQMGEAALIDAGFYKSDGTRGNDWRGQWTGQAGVHSLQDFLNSPSAQAQAVTAYQQRLWTYIQRAGLTQYLGSTVNGIQMTQSGMVAAAHLVGTGNLRTFLQSGGTVVPRDGNRTPITEYVSRFGGYVLSGTGANCADFARGSATSGVPVATDGASTTTSSGATGIAAAPSLSPVNAEDAYYQATGHTSGQLTELIKMIFAAVFLLATSISVFGNWVLFSDGALPWVRFLREQQRILVLTTFTLLMLL